MNPNVPDDIQVLLDCLRNREDLQLDEMQPLQDWIDETPGGELVVAQAVAKNAQLEEALEAIDIRVPKTLERQLSAYVNQNMDAVDSGAEPQVEKDRSKFWMFDTRSRYLSGSLSGFAVLLLIGASVLYVNGRYGDLDANHLAESSTNWIDKLDKQNLWDAPGGQQMLFPDEMVAHNLNGVVEFYSEYGDTSAYRFRSYTGVEGVLFIFDSSKEFPFRHIGKHPDVTLGDRFVGIGKEGDQVRVLVVESTAESDFGRFIRTDYRNAIAALVQIVWLLC